MEKTGYILNNSIEKDSFKSGSFWKSIYYERWEYNKIIKLSYLYLAIKVSSQFNFDIS